MVGNDGVQWWAMVVVVVVVVVVGNGEQCWAMLGNAGQCWAMLGNAGQCWAISGQCWAIFSVFYMETVSSTPTEPTTTTPAGNITQPSKTSERQKNPKRVAAGKAGAEKHRQNKLAMKNGSSDQSGSVSLSSGGFFSGITLSHFLTFASIMATLGGIYFQNRQLSSLRSETFQSRPAASQLRSAESEPSQRFANASLHSDSEKKNPPAVPAHGRPRMI